MRWLAVWRCAFCGFELPGEPSSEAPVDECPNCGHGEFVPAREYPEPDAPEPEPNP